MSFAYSCLGAGKIVVHSRVDVGEGGRIEFDGRREASLGSKATLQDVVDRLNGARRESNLAAGTPLLNPDLADLEWLNGDGTLKTMGNTYAPLDAADDAADGGDADEDTEEGGVVRPKRRGSVKLIVADIAAKDAVVCSEQEQQDRKASEEEERKRQSWEKANKERRAADTAATEVFEGFEDEQPLEPIVRVEANVGTLTRAGGYVLGFGLSSASGPTAGLGITDVAPRGQAELLGFRAGQEVLSINGQDVRGCTAQQAGGAIMASESIEVQCNTALAPKETPGPIVRVPEHIATLHQSGGQTLGLTIIGAPNAQAGVHIDGVTAGGQAELLGFKAGLNILTINRQDVRGWPRERAGEALMASEAVELNCDAPLDSSAETFTPAVFGVQLKPTPEKAAADGQGAGQEAAGDSDPASKFGEALHGAASRAGQTDAGASTTVEEGADGTEDEAGVATEDEQETAAEPAPRKPRFCFCF